MVRILSKSWLKIGPRFGEIILPFRQSRLWPTGLTLHLSVQDQCNDAGALACIPKTTATILRQQKMLITYAKQHRNSQIAYCQFNRTRSKRCSNPEFLSYPTRCTGFLYKAGEVKLVAWSETRESAIKFSLFTSCNRDRKAKREHL